MQTSYNQYQDAGFAGLIYDGSMRDVMSYSAEGAVDFAAPVVLGTNPERQIKEAGTGVGQGALVVGIAAASHSVEQSSAGVAQYPDKDTVPVVKDGRIWVQTEDAVVAGATANLVLASGKFTDTAVGAGIEAFTQISVKFVTSTTAAGLAAVEVK